MEIFLPFTTVFYMLYLMREDYVPNREMERTFWILVTLLGSYFINTYYTIKPYRDKGAPCYRNTTEERQQTCFCHVSSFPLTKNCMHSPSSIQYSNRTIGQFIQLGLLTPACQYLSIFDSSKSSKIFFGVNTKLCSPTSNELYMLQKSLQFCVAAAK